MKKELENSENAHCRGGYRLVAILSVIIALMVVPPSLEQAYQLDLNCVAVTHVSQINDVPIDQLTIINKAWLGGEVFRAKVLDNQTGEIYLANLHSSGELATDQEVKDLLSAALQKGFVGKVEERLKAKIDADPSGISRINIWVKTPDIPLTAWHSALQQGRREQVFSEAAAFHAQAESPVLKLLHSVGVYEKYASQQAPVISCEIPNRLLQQLENMPEVTRIYDDGIPGAALYASVPTIKAQKVWNQGITGFGVSVAVVEAHVNGYDAVVGNSPRLGTVLYYDSMNTQASLHATEVAGVIASNDGYYKGVSHGVNRPILSGNPTDPSASALNDATRWAAQQGANVINQSYRSLQPDGNIGIMGLYDDYIVGLYLPTIVVCAGNIDLDSGYSPRVDDPAVAYNVIAVGAFSDYADSNWGNDVIPGYSAYVNPYSAHNDREKPEIAAPGEVFSTLDVSPWVPSPYAAGTSFSAPHVSGTAALLMQAKSSLKTAPEEVKAILMASAIHNIEGATRLSDKDGAGGLQAKAAYDLVVNAWSSHFSDTTLGSCRTVTFNATAGQVIRFVISWLSRCDGSNEIVDDLDLTLKNPGGTVIGTCASFDNNFEIIEVTAPSTGTYTASVCPKGFGTGFKPNFGWAYYLQ